ncbi:MAG: apolipoprotein N-acyltransferase [Deltaproteobacteria bacterium]|nr:apolipoprotein N-acyltransferase [Deltaproteobacteria bacterium]
MSAPFDEACPTPPRPHGGRLYKLGLLTLGALLYTIACPPYDWSGAGWIALTPFFLALRQHTPRTGFVLGLLFGVLCCAGIGFWIYVAVTTYFALPFPLDILFTLFNYGLFAGVYVGLVAVLVCVLFRHGSPLLVVLGAPAVWVAGEFARSTWFAGIAWELLGYTQHQHPVLIQIADITGVYGLSYLLALSGAVGAEILVFLAAYARRETRAAPTQRFPMHAVVILAASVAVVVGYGARQLRHYDAPAAPEARPLTVAVVHANVESSQRWQRAHYASTLLTYLRLTQQGIANEQPNLIIWPEFALGFYLDREPMFHQQLSAFTRATNAFLLVGAPRMDETDTGTQSYNSAYLLSPQGEVVDVYDKIRLIPFAEYLPFAHHLLRPTRSEVPNDFTPGHRATIFSQPHRPWGVTICYEVTYPPMSRRLVLEGAEFLVNISNDTWGAGEAAAAQHFSMAVFRAVENRRPLVRAATAGISGFIDPVGRPYAVSADAEGVRIGTIVPRSELTLYARYGDWFALLCTAAAVLTLLSGVYQSRQARWQP